LREQDAIGQVGRQRNTHGTTQTHLEFIRPRLRGRAADAFGAMGDIRIERARRLTAQSAAELKAVHGSLTPATWSAKPSCPFNFCRARNSWVITAASPRPSNAAISVQENPPITCSTNGSRYFASRRAIAARSADSSVRCS